MRTFPNNAKRHPKKTLTTLNKFEMMAVVKKHEGKSYRTIANELNSEFSNKINRHFSPQLLRHWFMQGGKLYRAYWDYVDRWNVNNIRDAEGWLKSYITDAVLTVQEIVKDPKHPHAHSMAMAVIRRCWGTPKQQYERREKERREQEEKEREEERRAHKFDGWSKQELESYIKTLQHQRKMQIISELREIIKSKDNQ